MKIGTRELGPDQSVFVIAEIGVNHDGSVERAIDLVHAARDAGADAVKLQVFSADRLMHRSARFATYQASRVDAADPAEMLRRYELDDSALLRIATVAADARLIALATPFSPEDVDRVAAFGTAIKIASPDLVNRVLLARVIKAGLPMLVSTGAADADEVERATNWLRRKGATLALLHCVSAYPVAAGDAQLNWIRWLARFGVPVGYSDHTSEPVTGALAVIAGACIVEKHITYDVAASGPDHSASFNAMQFAEYVRLIRIAEQMRGDGGPRHQLECEKDVRGVSRQSLVAARAIPAGARIDVGSLTTQRPGLGISAECVDDVVGRRARRDIAAGEILTADLVEGWR